MDKEEKIADGSAILERVEKLCNLIRPGHFIVIIGSAAILVQNESARSTGDVDILNTVRVVGYSNLDIQIVNEGILFLLPDYKDRLIHLATFNGVDVYSLHPLDISLVKLGRGEEKDLTDIKFMLGNGMVTLDDFKTKYKEFREGYGGSYAIIDGYYFDVTGEKYTDEGKLF